MATHDLHPECLYTVVIPARDEVELIRVSLDAICRQIDRGGKPLDPRLFEVIVLANGCCDGTASAVLEFAALHPAYAIHLVEATSTDIKNVGMARRALMDAAAERFMHIGRRRGVIVSTDADTLLAPDFLAQLLVEIEGVDAVAGSVTIDPDELARLPDAFADLYRKELTYREAFARLDSVVDAVPHDPWPRHASFVGAAFGVTADAYLASGGIPPVAMLEDREFFYALRGIDARVRHSLAVRATTSARRLARVDGGFGSFVADLHVRGVRGETFCVEHPSLTLRKMAISAIARRSEADLLSESDLDELEAIMQAPRELWLRQARSAMSAGALCELLIAVEMLTTTDLVTVDAAIVALQSIIALRTLGPTPQYDLHDSPRQRPRVASEKHLHLVPVLASDLAPIPIAVRKAYPDSGDWRRAKQ